MTRKPPRPPIIQYGEALFGERWKAPLARALGVNIRTVKRWAAGEFQPHDGVWDDVRAMLKKRGIALRAMAGE
jgi:hypothetical protein